MSLITRLLSGVDRARLRIVGAVLLAACASGATVALMATSAWMLSRAAEHPSEQALAVAAVGVRFFGISRGVFRYAERLLGHDLGLRMQSSLRLLTYERLARTTLLGRRRGDLLARVVSDVEAILDLVVRVFVPFASGLLVILGTTVILGTFNAASAGVLLVTALIAALGAPWIAQRLSRAEDAGAVPARGALADVVHEIARTAPDLVAYGADAAALDRLMAADATLRRAEQRAAWSRGIAAAIQLLAAGAAVVSALVIGGTAVAEGRLDRTMLAVLVLTPLALHDVFGDFARAAQTLTRARSALARVEAVVDAPPVGLGDLDPTPTAAGPRIEVVDATIGWPGAAPLAEHLTLSVGPGERVALVGPSGVGKTTVAATILGLIPPLAGEVRTTGRLGYLAQDSHIFTTSVEENVKIGNKDASPAQVTDALARAGLALDPKLAVGEIGSPLSGGERRRLAASRLLVGDYQAIILDEPSEHLDPETADALLDDLWASTAGAPTLVITHDPEVVARCDGVLRLGPRGVGS